MSDAGWALAGVVIGGLFAGIINYFLQKGQFKHNKEMFVLQNQSTEVVKSLLAEKLSNESYTDRSFEALKQPIGGYSDDEVRQLLHEIGERGFQAKMEQNRGICFLEKRRGQRDGKGRRQHNLLISSHLLAHASSE